MSITLPALSCLAAPKAKPVLAVTSGKLSFRRPCILSSLDLKLFVTSGMAALLKPATLVVVVISSPSRVSPVRLTALLGRVKAYTDFTLSILRAVAPTTGRGARNVKLMSVEACLAVAVAAVLIG